MTPPTPSDTIRTRLAFAFEAAETEEDRAWVNEGQEALAMMEAEVERRRNALERLAELHASLIVVDAGLNFDLSRMKEFGPNYNQAVKDGLARLGAICDTLADILLAQPGDAA